MQENLWCVLDLLMIMILLAAIYSGIRMGFFKSVMYLISYAAAVIIALPVSSLISGGIYNAYIKEKCIDKIEESAADYNIAGTLKNYMSSFGVEIDENEISRQLDSGNTEAVLSNFRSALGENYYKEKQFVKELNDGISGQIKNKLNGNLPDFLLNAINLADYPTGELLDEAGDLLADTVEALNSTPRERAAFIEEHYFRSIIVLIITIIVFQILFFILLRVFHKIVNTIKTAGDAIGLGSSDRILGAVFGFVKGIVIIFIAALLMKLIVIFSGDSIALINSAAIEKTFIFKIFYNLY